ncbi:MAG: hypothetical protein ABL927_04610 [Bdellovibrionales bacterium]
MTAQNKNFSSYQSVRFITPMLLICAIYCLSLLSTSCSSQGNPISMIPLCPISYKPLDISKSKLYSDKIEVKPGFNPPANDYAYSGSELFYYDKTQDIKIHLIDTLTSEGKNKVSVLCVGGTGLKKGMNPLSFDLQFVSDLLIEANGKSQIRNRAYHIDIRERVGEAPLLISADREDIVYVNGSPVDTFLNYDSSTQFFLQNARAPKKFDLHAELTSTLRDSKSNKVADLEIRTIVHMREVTAEERSELDKKITF